MKPVALSTTQPALGFRQFLDPVGSLLMEKCPWNIAVFLGYSWSQKSPPGLRKSPFSFHSRQSVRGVRQFCGPLTVFFWPRHSPEVIFYLWSKQLLLSQTTSRGDNWCETHLFCNKWKAINNTHLAPNNIIPVMLAIYGHTKTMFCLHMYT